MSTIVKNVQFNINKYITQEEIEELKKYLFDKKNSVIKNNLELIQENIKKFRQ